MLKEISVRTSARVQLIDITSEVQNIIENGTIKDGVCIVYVPHTTAAVTINENADPSVQSDLIMGLNNIVPSTWKYSHNEGNSDAHIKSSLIGVSEMIIIEDKKLKLGTWQGIYFCEFDGPRNRRVFVKVV